MTLVPENQNGKRKIAFASCNEKVNPQRNIFLYRLRGRHSLFAPNSIPLNWVHYQGYQLITLFMTLDEDYVSDWAYWIPSGKGR